MQNPLLPLFLHSTRKLFRDVLRFATVGTFELHLHAAPTTPVWSATSQLVLSPHSEATRFISGRALAIVRGSASVRMAGNHTTKRRRQANLGQGRGARSCGGMDVGRACAEVFWEGPTKNQAYAGPSAPRCKFAVHTPDYRCRPRLGAQPVGCECQRFPWHFGRSCVKMFVRSLGSGARRRPSFFQTRNAFMS